MELPAARFMLVHAVLQPAGAIQRDPAAVASFIAAVGQEFPTVLAQQYVPAEVPAQVPHLTLASSSSQLAVSAAQIDFEVRFYGDYLEDVSRGLAYVETKLKSVIAGFVAIDATPSILGLVASFQFSLKDQDADPVEHILRHHLRVDLDGTDVQDAQAKVAVKVADKYFVNMTVSNFESRLFQRPIMPHMAAIRVRPWEGQLDDYGLDLAVDINNSLEARVGRADPVVTDAGVAAVLGLLRTVATSTGPRYVSRGHLSIADLATGVPA